MSKFEFQDIFTEVEITGHKFRVNVSKFRDISAKWEKTGEKMIEQARAGNAKETTVRDLYYGALREMLNDEKAGEKIWNGREFDVLEALKLLYWIKDEVLKFRKTEIAAIQKTNTPKPNRAQRRAAGKAAGQKNAPVS